MSAGSVYSAMLCDRPLRLGTKIIEAGHTREHLQRIIRAAGKGPVERDAEVAGACAGLRGGIGGDEEEGDYRRCGNSRVSHCQSVQAGFPTVRRKVPPASEETLWRTPGLAEISWPGDRS